jgi:hypothetical protein
MLSSTDAHSDEVMDLPSVCSFFEKLPFQRGLLRPDVDGGAFRGKLLAGRERTASACYLRLQHMARRRHRQV